MVISGDSTSKTSPSHTPEIPEISEDDRKDTFNNDYDLEVSHPTITKKPRRKSQRNKKESAADREKELGIQKLINEALKKDGKSRKNKATQHK